MKIARLPGRIRPSGSASKTVAGIPSLRRAKAAVNPTGPAPTTKTGRWNWVAPLLKNISSQENFNHQLIPVFMLSRSRFRIETVFNIPKM
jgi:hypothetical protein